MRRHNYVFLIFTSVPVLHTISHGVIIVVVVVLSVHDSVRSLCKGMSDETAVSVFFGLVPWNLEKQSVQVGVFLPQSHEMGREYIVPSSLLASIVLCTF
jgi:hypothetical protein